MRIRSIHGGWPWFLGALLLVSACGPREEPAPQPEAPAPASTPQSTAPVEPSEPEAPPLEDPSQVPEPDYTDMESQVEKRLRETRAAVLSHPESAEAWGQYGMVTHAHELWPEAELAYRWAEHFDPQDVRWPYFLGDVLSVTGTTPTRTLDAFRRALALRSDYAPTHMRLGKVLIAADQNTEAAEHLEKALELEADLQPARVALAQIELSRGNLERSESLLQAVLQKAPRHAQALSTLGQVFMRQGHRDAARKVALRAQSAAIYNLYSDPLMGQVVNEGISSVLLWERAKAFLDNGNSKEAAKGLEQVVHLLPENPAAHQQLAMAYRNLGNLEQAFKHIELVVKLEPERPEPKIQLADLYIDLQEPALAIVYLKRALKIAPDNLDARWLRGRAEVLVGDIAAGLEAFEDAKVRAATANQPIPSWVHKEWGSALAQNRQFEAARDHFRLDLAENPNNAQSLFYMGLVHEGLSSLDEAVVYYCRSLTAQANPPAAARLQALGQSCN